MIPEIEVTCRGERLFINSVTVEQYKKYISLMEKNDTEKFSGVMFFNKKIMQEMFGNELSLAAVGEIDTNVMGYGSTIRLLQLPCSVAAVATGRGAVCRTGLWTTLRRT